jgi:hypothetical protein
MMILWYHPMPPKILGKLLRGARRDPRQKFAEGKLFARNVKP